MLYLSHRPRPDRKVMTPPAIDADRLRAHVEMLAGEIGEHNVLIPAALRRAEEYIIRVWRDQGYAVVRQTYRVNAVECANLEVTRPGGSEIILIGAHYDSVSGSPGANDNGSGVAALLELSRIFSAQTPAKTLRFVAFVNEEPPYFHAEQQGSRVYAKAARLRGDDIGTMISLETMGYFSDSPDSQEFPSPLLKLFYPGEGRFITLISDFGSRLVMQRSAAAFQAHTDFPIECFAIPFGGMGADLSDHAEFWRVGYRALMVTDTAMFRYPHYHTKQDTPDKVNYRALARITAGLAGVVKTLSGTN
jgi:Zn-dependent M28 family amino/carboxypeptidase